MSSGERAVWGILAVIITIFGGIMSGLNLGMLSLDKKEMEARFVSAVECLKSLREALPARTVRELSTEQRATIDVARAMSG